MDLCSYITQDHINKLKDLIERIEALGYDESDDARIKTRIIIKELRTLKNELKGSYNSPYL